MKRKWLIPCAAIVLIPVILAVLALSLSPRTQGTREALRMAAAPEQGKLVWLDSSGIRFEAGEASVLEESWSLDRRRVALVMENEAGVRELYAVDSCNAVKVAADVFDAVISADGSAIAYIADEAEEWGKLYHYSIDQKETQLLADRVYAGIRYPRFPVTISAGGKAVGYCADMNMEDAASFHGVVQPVGGEAVSLGLRCYPLAFSDDGAYIWYLSPEQEEYRIITVDTIYNTLSLRHGAENVRIAGGLQEEREIGELHFNADCSELLVCYEGSAPQWEVFSWETGGEQLAWLDGKPELSSAVRRESCRLLNADCRFYSVESFGGAVIAKDEYGCGLGYLNERLEPLTLQQKLDKAICYKGGLLGIEREEARLCYLPEPESLQKISAAGGVRAFLADEQADEVWYCLENGTLYRHTGQGETLVAEDCTFFARGVGAFTMFYIREGTVFGVKQSGEVQAFDVPGAVERVEIIGDRAAALVRVGRYLPDSLLGIADGELGIYDWYRLDEAGGSELFASGLTAALYGLSEPVSSYRLG